MSLADEIAAMHRELDAKEAAHPSRADVAGHVRIARNQLRIIAGAEGPYPEIIEAMRTNAERLAARIAGAATVHARADHA
jgi:hypothetical protein